MDPQGHVLRHRTASGRNLTNQWDISEMDGKLLCSIQVASGPIVHVALVVKSLRHRNRRGGEFGCWPLGSTREQWSVEHGVYDALLDPPHPMLPPMQLVLTNAPPDVAARLALICAD